MELKQSLTKLSDVPLSGDLTLCLKECYKMAVRYKRADIPCRGICSLIDDWAEVNLVPDRVRDTLLDEFRSLLGKVQKVANIRGFKLKCHTYNYWFDGLWTPRIAFLKELLKDR